MLYIQKPVVYKEIHVQEYSLSVKLALFIK